jgi:two-component system NtrC family sensor kinase
LPEIRCYPQRINQVLMNILINAGQAIQGNGRITIKTRAENQRVVLTISDNGEGIAPEHLNKIFDPFFTTKEVGKGTGLGLNVAYNVIQQHKGQIDVNSVVGQGTTFVIHLPVEPEFDENPTT